MHRSGLILTAFAVVCLSLADPGTGLAQVSLVRVGMTNDGGGAFSVAVSGNYAYLANTGDGLRIYDISNPARPLNVGHTNNGAYAFGATLSGSYAYLANYNDGLRIYDVSDPSNPLNVGHAYNGGYASSAVAVSGHYAYLQCNGLEIYDVSDPANPVQVAHGLAGGYSLAFSSNCLYASAPNSAHTIYAYDVSNPAAPTNVYASGGGYIFGLATSSNRLFTGAESFQVGTQSKSGLLAFDISNRTNPVFLATSGGPGFAGGGLAVSGDYVYWANGDYGLQIYNVSSPIGTNIAKVGEIKDGRAENVVVNGTFAYVADNTSGLRIYAILPQLDLKLTNAGSMVFSWADTAPFSLQQNPDPGAADWTTLTNAPVVSGGRSQLTMTRPGGKMFYRLTSP